MEDVGDLDKETFGGNGENKIWLMQAQERTAEKLDTESKSITVSIFRSVILLKLYSRFCVYLDFSGKRTCPFPKILRKIPDPKEFKTIKIIVYSIHFIFSDFNQTWVKFLC